ncbi:MAG TPA: glycoside hydrolase family 2 TIM barrel-domain containing protein [Polyangia bacterium]|nr:glycoside hydrolase family 2 TIM barrel-domain containing protein [Polyangia bacterium]
MTPDLSTEAAGATQPPPLLTAVAQRQARRLAGAWHTIVDPYETGYIDYRYEPRAKTFGKRLRATERWDLIEYDFDKSPILRVPGDWNSQRTDLHWYEGTIWYEKTFNFSQSQSQSAAAGARQFLYFSAAAARARVWLNGDELGTHEGGFTPFCFEITGRLLPRGNFVVVKVDNTRRRDAIPTWNTDWWNYGGLTRDVWVVETPATFVREAFAQVDPAAPDEVSGWLQLDGPEAAGAPVTLEIPGAKLKVAAVTDGQGRAAFRASAAKLKRWSPEHPRLYDVVFAGGGDRLRERIGFRTIATRGTEILLNGAPLFLRGISIHEEAPWRGGRVRNETECRRLLASAQALGCNFVRLAHYPHSEEMTRAADRLGLLVWSEIPVYWTIDWQNPATLANARQQLRENITRDRNRASIAIWSVANETPIGPPRTTFLRTLIADARALDPTRLVSAALEKDYADATTVRIDDPLGHDLDVIGCNEYIGWYDGLPDKCATITWTTAFDKPMVMTEFGGDARAGKHGDPLTRFSEEYQENLYQQTIAMLRRIPFLAGTSPWILYDFRSPRRPLPGVQDYWNRKGLLSESGVKKKAYFVLRRYYGDIAKQR